MPPKRAAKRKAPSESPDGESDAGPSASQTQVGTQDAGPSQTQSETQVGTQEGSQKKGRPAKKAKIGKNASAGASTDAEGGLAPNGQPTNKVLPTHIEFAPRAEGTVRIATWNICGLAAASKKGFKYYVEAEDADILVLTETKVNNDPVDPALTSRYPYRHWAISEKKSYSGTAILSKQPPLSVSKDLPGHPDAAAVKGRIVTLEFAGCYVVGTYVVNAGQGLKTLDAKKEWNVHFERYIRALDRKKPVIWTGDLNVAPTEMDLANPKTNWNKTPGYTEAETTAFARVLSGEGCADGGEQRFVDVWRRLHATERHYTYFSYRFNCRSKGLGWRLDTFVVSERLVGRVRRCEIRSAVYGASDHVPVVLEVEGPL